MTTKEKRLLLSDLIESLKEKQEMYDNGLIPYNQVESHERVVKFVAKHL